jgi:hypothetical protein
MQKKVIIILSLLLMLNSANSQDSKSKQLVSVNLDITGKGSPTKCANADTSDYYFATINVFNTQDTTVAFWIMSCSWPMDGFVIYSDSIAFQFCFSGCDNNIPEKISLPQKKSIQFYGTIKSWKKDSSIARVKVGFRYFRTVDELWNFDGSNDSKKVNKIVWSNEVKLYDNLYSYEIK